MVVFFDLMYVNYENPTLNPHKHYTFIRSCEDETLVIAVNFGSEKAEIDINIPEHAFEMLNLPQGTCTATELLSKEKAEKKLSPTKPFNTIIGPHNAVVWKIKHKNVTGTSKNL